MFAALAIVGVCSVLLPQEPQTPRFRVPVDAVRIDAVVTDRDGNTVRDPTANDFEVFQDGKPQKVTFAQFVALTGTKQRDASEAPLPAANVVAAPRVAGVPVRRENIQCTIALVVDDLGLSLESLYYLKHPLHNYIDHSIRTGDLVAL